MNTISRPNCGTARSKSLRYLLEHKLRAHRQDETAVRDMMREARQLIGIEDRRRDERPTDLDVLNAMADALAGSGEDAAIRELVGRLPGPPLRPISDWADEPEPVPVIWRDDPDLSDSEPVRDSVLAEGEVCILSGAGGLGKSLISLELANAAGVAAEEKQPYGRALAFRMRPGAVALISYEDKPVRVAARLRRAHGPGDPWRRTIHVFGKPEPLFVQTDLGFMPSPDWDGTWARVREAEVPISFVVVDPASSAMPTTIDGAAVRSFLRSLELEAERAGVGVLVVAHDTKAARNVAASGGDPGAGAVSGSATWSDGARSVLYTTRTNPGSDRRRLTCIKANYGPSGWHVDLIDRRDKSGRFLGLVAEGGTDELSDPY